MDTLLPSGSIQGKVSVQGRAPALVFCYLQGSTYVALTDSTGAFFLDRIPAGSYRLNYVSEGFLAAVDSPVVVASGRITLQPTREMLSDISGQPPAPHILEAYFDTGTGSAFIKWNRAQAPDLAAYRVESHRSGSGPNAYNVETIVWDTVFSDDLSESLSPGYNPDGTGEAAYVYRIRAIDSEGNVSRITADSVTIMTIRPPEAKFQATLSLVEGQIGVPICHDTLLFALSSDRLILSGYDVQWVMNSWIRRDFKPEYRMNYYPGFSFNSADTLRWFWSRGRSLEDTARKPDSLAIWGELVTENPYHRGDGIRPKIKTDGGVADIRVDAQGCYTVMRIRKPRIPYDGNWY